MNNVHFVSCLAESLIDLVNAKRIQGYDYTAQAEMLGYFDRFLDQEGWTQHRLSSELLHRYVQHTETLAPNTRIGRLSAVKVFSRFLHTHVPDSAVLCHIPVKRPSLPRFYLYTHAEVNELLQAALQLRPRGSLRPHCFHMLIGLIAVTGLRIGEALGLQLADLESELSRVLVRNGKFAKQRYVAIDSSTVGRLQVYLHIRQQHGPAGAKDALFLDRKGRPLSYSLAQETFRALCRRTHIGLDAAKPPRLHDLRHGYACNCLEKWRREGADVNAKLPLLSTAMGHTMIEHTQVYLHVTPEQLKEATERLRNHLTTENDRNTEQ